MHHGQGHRHVIVYGQPGNVRPCRDRAVAARFQRRKMGRKYSTSCAHIASSQCSSSSSREEINVLPPQTSVFDSPPENALVSACLVVFP